MTNFPIYKKSSPAGYDDVEDYEDPHPWPMKPDAEAPPEDPEDEFKKCQADAVLQFKQARSPDEKRSAMKAGARCLGHRCDQIAKRDLQTAPDAPSKKVILDAQKACHIGSGTTEDQKDPDENAPPKQNIWKETDMYGDETIPANSRSHDYEKTRVDPRIPIKSRTEPQWTGPSIPISDDDKEAAKVAEKKERDIKNHKQDAEDLEKRHKADEEHT